MVFGKQYLRMAFTRRCFAVLVSFLVAGFFPLVSSAQSEIRKFLIEIRNSEDQPIEGVRVKCRGHSELSPLTGPSGLTELPLPPGLQPGDEIEIELEPGTDLEKNWRFLKPFDGSVNVPSQKQRYYTIILIRRDYLDTMLKAATAPTDAARDIKIDRFDRSPTPLGQKFDPR
jgi:hypothetical protein